MRHGFTRHGFTRHGFTRHGFTRHGFTRHGLIRHGFLSTSRAYQALVIAERLAKMPTRYFNFVFFIAALVLGAQPALSAESSGALSSYRLGSGDVISIQVLGEEDLKREKLRLSDAGTISYPILGEIKVFGITVGELEKIITTGLKGRYLLNPSVTVTVLEYRPFFVNGQVEKPGGYPFVPGLTVRKAVSIAGGFKERASQQKIFVIRDTDPTQTPVRVNLNSVINPGDILTVEESFF